MGISLMPLVRLVLGGQVVSTGAAWLTVSTRLVPRRSGHDDSLSAQ